MNKLLVGIVIIILIVLGYMGMQRGWFSASSRDTSAVCTQEAKVCPDGSSVGRVAPDCNFAACPGE